MKYSHTYFNMKVNHICKNGFIYLCEIIKVSGISKNSNNTSSIKSFKELPFLIIMKIYFWKSSLVLVTMLLETLVTEG